MKPVILIPAYNPDENLIQVVDRLIALDIPHIIVVDDGSKPQCKEIFRQVQQKEQCHVLFHAVNSGKGRALKTGFNYFCLHFPDSPGVVTADADGQHQSADILKVIAALEENPERLIIGSRQWEGHIPFRSLFGNFLTRAIFSLLVGKKLSDTQSGLRGIPRSFIYRILTLKGERYEYEMNMLIETKVESVKILEIPIDTIYIENNKSSHFNPLVDSMKIYFLLFRFLFSSLFSALIDFIAFISIYKTTRNLLYAIIVARIVSGSVNFLVNKNIVFKDRNRFIPTLFKFVLLLVVRGIISYLLIERLSFFFGFTVTTLYLVVESTLFWASFALQRDFVFYHRQEE